MTQEKLFTRWVSIAFIAAFAAAILALTFSGQASIYS